MEFNPADTSRYPSPFLQTTDELRLVVGLQPTTKLSYQGSARILSNAENKPDLLLSFAAREQDRVGVPNYVSHAAQEISSASTSRAEPKSASR